MKMSYRSLALLLAALLTLTAWLPAAALADEGDAGGAPQPVGSAPQPQPGGTGDASAGETPIAETPPPAATATPAGPVVTVEVNTPPPDTPAPAAALRIDSQNLYSGMAATYAQGYAPTVSGGKATIILPLQCSARLAGDSLVATPNLGSPSGSPFVFGNYQQVVPLSTQPVNGGKEQAQAYYVRFDLALSSSRINGVYPVVITVEAYDTAGNELREEFTTYVTITDGQDPPKESTGGGSSGPTASKPVLMVTTCTLSASTLKAGDTVQVNLTAENVGRRTANNIRATIVSDDANIVLLNAFSAQYVRALASGDETPFSFELQVLPHAVGGMHTMTIQLNYEGPDNSAYTENAVFRFTVEQEAALEYQHVFRVGKRRDLFHKARLIRHPANLIDDFAHVFGLMPELKPLPRDLFVPGFEEHIDVHDAKRVRLAARAGQRSDDLAPAVILAGIFQRGDALSIMEIGCCILRGVIGLRNVDIRFAIVRHGIFGQVYIHLQRSDPFGRIESYGLLVVAEQFGSVGPKNWQEAVRRIFCVPRYHGVCVIADGSLAEDRRRREQLLPGGGRFDISLVERFAVDQYGTDGHVGGQRPERAVHGTDLAGCFGEVVVERFADVILRRSDVAGFHELNGPGGEAVHGVRHIAAFGQSQDLGISVGIGPVFNVYLDAGLCFESCGGFLKQLEPGSAQGDIGDLLGFGGRLSVIVRGRRLRITVSVRGGIRAANDAQKHEGDEQHRKYLFHYLLSFSLFMKTPSASSPGNE